MQVDQCASHALVVMQERVKALTETIRQFKADGCMPAVALLGPISAGKPQLVQKFLFWTSCCFFSAVANEVSALQVRAPSSTQWPHFYPSSWN